MPTRNFVSGVLLLLASSLVGTSASADVVVLAKSEPVVGQGLSTRTYDFIVDTPGDYLGELLDLEFLAPFQLLAVGISETGGNLISQQTQPGSFLLPSLGVGSYSALLFAQPGGDNFASTFSLNIALIPEPGGWLMIMTGLGLLGWQIRRRHSMLSLA